MQMVPIFHIETFVTFFYSSLISRLITDSDFNRIQWYFGPKLVDDRATELYIWNNWKIWSNSEEKKNLLYALLFFFFLTAIYSSVCQFYFQTCDPSDQ